MNRKQRRERNRAANTNPRARKKEEVNYSTVMCFKKNCSTAKSGLKFDALPPYLSGRHQTVAKERLTFTNAELEKWTFEFHPPSCTVL